MNGVIIVGHGRLAEEMLETTRMIVGTCDGVFAVDLLSDEDPSVIAERVRAILDSLEPGDACLALLDLLGGSPAQACSRLALHDPRLELVTGVNLPMLLEVIIHKDNMSLGELVDLAEEKGTIGITNVRRKLAEREGGNS